MPQIPPVTPSPALRDALIAAMLPAPGGGLPGAGDLDLSDFWKRFETVAPLHLRLAFRTATLILAGMLPLALGYRRSLAKLDADTRQTILLRATKIPAMAPLIEIVKVVVAFAYFDDPKVEAIVRGRA
jgi:hypothetical protein